MTEDRFARMEGQIDGLFALLVGLAQQLDPKQFCDDGLAAIERRRAQLLTQAVPDARLQGLDAIEAWVKALTSY